MSILTGPEIVRQVRRYKEARYLVESDADLPFKRYIDIDPFDERLAGPNSYDVHLADTLLVYHRHQVSPNGNARNWLATDEPNTTEPITIPPSGLLLYPGTLYLGRTVERTKTAGYVPWLDGRSSMGRLGLFIHTTAGRGDSGFGCNTPDGLGCTWTLELSVIHPLHIKPGLRIGQLTFFSTEGEQSLYKGRYAAQGDAPVASRLHEDK